MKAKDLRSSILQLAISGKLVPQNPDDEPASVLLAKIRAEKAKLVKEGKIKKQKPLPPVTEDEKPFDIPDSWVWVRFGEICTKLTDGSHTPPPNTGKGYPVISAKNVKNGYVILQNTDRFTDEDGFKKENSRTNISYGDIILGIIGGSIGNTAIYLHYDKVIAQRSIAIINTLCSNMFIYNFLNSPLAQDYLQEKCSGSAQGGVYLETLSMMPLPLPSLNEQKRVVAKIEELLPFINDYDKAEAELSALNETFPQNLRKSLLQYAVEGKLVPQDHNDEPASVLLEKIRAEKAKLVKEGKIKPQKPLPPITEDEKPFDIPDNWVWVRLGSLGEWLGGGTPSMTQKSYWTNGNIPWVTPKDMKTTVITDSQIKITESAVENSTAKYINPPAIIFVVRSGILRRLLPVAKTTCKITVNQDIKALNLYTGLYVDYIMWACIANDTNIRSACAKNGTTVESIIVGKLFNYAIPFPPLAEQKRIVAKLEQLLPYCGDKLFSFAADK